MSADYKYTKTTTNAIDEVTRELIKTAKVIKESYKTITTHCSIKYI